MTATVDGAVDAPVDEPGVAPAVEPDGVEARRLLRLSILIAWIPTVCSVAWAIAHEQWQAGDRSIMGVFTHDVFSKHTPLLATVSTMGNYSDAENAGAVHHLGPAQFWALSIPDWITGGRPVGLILGALWINAACIALVVVFTKRRLGVRAAAGMALVCTLLSYGLGPSLLRDIWTPFLGLWPLLALMVLVWSLLDGDTRALPYAVVVATFLAQIELLFVAPAAVLSLVGGGGLLLRRWRLRRRRRAAAGAVATFDVAHLDDEALFTPTPAEPEPAVPAEPAQDLVPLRRPVVLSTALAIWLWSPVAWDEVHGRPGNLTLLWRALHEQQERAGWDFVWRNAIAQLQLPPVWVTRATSPFDVGHDLNAFHILSAGVFLAAYVTATVVARRQRAERPTRYALLVTGYGVLLAGFANLWITPQGGTIGLQYRRWMWPSGAYLWFALAVAGVTHLADRTDLRRLRQVPVRRFVLPVLAVAAVVCVPAGIGQTTPPSADVQATPIIESMWGPMYDRLPAQSTYVSMEGAGANFAIGPEIIRRLLVHGFEIRVPSFAGDSYGSFREYRKANGPTLAQKLAIVTGEEVSLRPSSDPVQLLGAGRRDGRSAEDYVARMQPVLARALSAPPIVVSDVARFQLITTLFPDRSGPDGSAALDDLLAHPARAIFDETLVGLLVDGQVTSAPMTPTEASAVLGDLKALGALAFLEVAPPPDD